MFFSNDVASVKAFIPGECDSNEYETKFNIFRHFRTDVLFLNIKKKS